MDIKEAIKQRHSVRQYKTLPLEAEAKEKLTELIKECNLQSGLNIQLVCDDPECFDTFFAPTAINQQKFFVSLENDEPVITTKGGPMTKIDLGIVKYNFEAASGHKCK
jgi:hypothetical protein